MRIISGRLKGILIQPPKGLPVRPTTDRAKESLFNILENHFNLEEITALDLFAGTGNISYEFYSRGAQSITAIDASDKCIQFIKQMKTKFDMNKMEVIRKNVYSFLKGPSILCDLIFADAPYADKDIIKIPGLVFEGKFLRPGGWLIVEHESHLDLSDQSTYFDKRVYGQSAFSFFK